MEEIENLKRLIKELDGHVVALTAFSNALLHELSKAQLQAVAANFESQCEQAAAFLLGQPDQHVEQQIAAVQLTRDTILGSADSQPETA